MIKRKPIRKTTDSTTKKVLNLWSTEEEQLAVDLFTDLILNQKLSLTEAKKIVAEKTNRTFDSVSYRYHKKFVNVLDHEVLLKVKENSVAIISNRHRQSANPVQIDIKDITSKNSIREQSQDNEVDFKQLPVYLNEYNDIQKKISELTQREQDLLKEIKKYEEYLSALRK